jgi:tetratricopeptide (TPR) repeat protein
MKLAIFLAALSLTLPAVATAKIVSQTAQVPASADSDKVAAAYEQFLIAHRAEQQNDVDGAIAAYKRAAALDPTSADILAELASLYLRQNRVQDATRAAEQALKVAPDNREANRVLGTIYAATLDAPAAANGRNAQTDRENLTKAIRYLELATDRPVGEPNPNVLATLARLYVAAGAFDKAIPLLTDLVNRETGWQEGALLLVNAYVGAGRNSDAIAWLEPQVADDPRLLSALADLYEREQRWNDAANTYRQAVERAPRNTDLKIRYASALMNVGGRGELARAREALSDVVSTRQTDARALYLLAQAQRRLGDTPAAEATARRLISLQTGQSPWGYHALAEALEQRGDFKGVVDAMTPAIAGFRARAGDASSELALLLPHLGFAHQELGEYDKAIAAFDEAHRLAPTDAAISGNLVEAYIAAKKFRTAIDVARQSRAARPDDWQLARLEAQALRHDGKADQGIALLESVVKKHAGEPAAHVALAQLYSDANRGGQAVKLLQDAEGKFPDTSVIAFELGAVFEKQKKYAEAEGAFRKVLAREPDNAAALNYLGYMLAERGERLDESVGYLKRALQMEPDNGSFLDSLGWAYFKADKLDLAEINLKRAADQLRTNSVIQDHYGDVLFKLEKYDEALAAWTLAAAGDGDAIDRGALDKKIRAAKQKLNKK